MFTNQCNTHTHTLSLSLFLSLSLALALFCLLCLSFSVGRSHVCRIQHIQIILDGLMEWGLTENRAYGPHRERWSP